MAPARVLGDIDIVSIEDLRRLGRSQGPCISLSMPTHRAGAETMQGSIRLGNLIDEADQRLEYAEVAKRDRWALLDPLRSLVDDFDFWQHQSEGLALFSAPGGVETFRVGLPLEEEVTVGSIFRIRPLLPAVSGNGAFLLLALTENKVQLFEITQHSIAQLDLGPIPGSKSEALWFEDQESQLQMRAGGEAAGGFHGHGLGDEQRKEALERYFRLVDKGIHERVGHSRRPMMLACVAYYEPIFRTVSDYPTIVSEIVEGSPERLRPEELHERAWPVMERHHAGALEAALDRYRQLAGTGMTAGTIEAVVESAAQGRVDTLLVAEGTPERWGSLDRTSGTVEITEEQRTLDNDLVDLAVVEALEHGGTVHVVPRGSTADIEVAAILRY